MYYNVVDTTTTNILMMVRIGNWNEPVYKLFRIKSYKVIISGMLSGILGYYVEILGFG